MKTYSEILSHVMTYACAIPHHKSLYRAQGIPVEMASVISELIGGNYSNYIEIGCAAGGTTRLYNDFFNFENIVIVDDNFQEKEYPYRKENLKGLPVVEYIGDSQSLEAKEFVRSLNLLFDIVYIDGDHSYQGVKNDFGNYFEFVKRSGYIILHDSQIFQGVKDFVKELKTDERLQFLIEYNKGMGTSIFKKL